MDSSAKQFLGKGKAKRGKKYQEFATKNLEKVEELLMQHRPGIAEEMKEDIKNFLLAALQQKECSFSIPAGFEPALLSHLLTNMALWIGNTQAALNTP